VQDFNPELAILALAGSAQLAAAKELGLKAIAEAFADRAYTADGLLMARSNPRALYHEPAIAVAQAIGIARDSSVMALDGSRVACNADSICLHGDNDAAFELARAVRDGLLVNDIIIKPAID